MKRPAVITIRATQSVGDESETTELVTEGYFGWQEGLAFLTYQETVATGFEGDTTTLRIEGEQKATLLRFGDSRTRLIVEPGRRHHCHYDTGAGILELEIVGRTIQNQLTAEGGAVELVYHIDCTHTLLAVNRVRISVRLRDPSFSPE